MTQSNLLNIDPALPVTEQDALLQSEKLVVRIKDLIKKQGGMIGFEQYMSTVLYEPGLGYYSADIHANRL